MKIALLTDGIYPYVLGGMQRHTFYLCKKLLQEGVQVDLYHTLWESEKDISALEVFSQEEKSRLNSYVIPWPKGNGLPGHYLRSSFAYSEAVYQSFLENSQDADFIYVKGFAGWKLLKEKKKSPLNIPVGIKFHGYEMYQIAPNLKVKLQHYLLRGPIKWNTLAADYVFSYGGKITNIISSLGVEQSKILEIPSGIEEEWLLDRPLKVHTPRRFVFLGRYERRKGIEELFTCLSQLINTETFEFHFIGPIPEALQIKNPSFHYHGKVLDSGKIREILRSSEILVCPSYSEGMPNVILEAMASGLYIIASDVGAISAMVNGENGQLIQAANKEELLQAMKAALKIPEKNLLLHKQNSLRKIKQNFLWSEIIQQTLTKIKKISSTSMPIR